MLEIFIYLSLVYDHCYATGFIKPEEICPFKVHFL